MIPRLRYAAYEGDYQMRCLFLSLCLMAGTTQAGEDVQQNCAETFSYSLETLHSSPKKLEKRMVFVPIGPKVERLEGCMDYRNTYGTNKPWVFELMGVFRSKRVEKVTIIKTENYKTTAEVILKDERKDQWTKHESVFSDDGRILFIWCKELPTPCDKEGKPL